MATAMDIHYALETLTREVGSYRVPVVDLIAVQTKDPFKVLVATILSARTRDEVTAAAARRLFALADTPAALAALPLATIEQAIYPVGFFHTKAVHLQKLPQALALFGGRVPNTMDGLLALPGVGRKTANLVLAVAFSIPAICVDTHVHRIMNIWGYVQTSTPLATEQALRKKLPRKYWLTVNSTLVSFGQHVCLPRRPRCDSCILHECCPKNDGIVKQSLTETMLGKSLFSERRCRKGMNDACEKDEDTPAGR